MTSLDHIAKTACCIVMTSWIESKTRVFSWLVGIEWSAAGRVCCGRTLRNSIGTPCPNRPGLPGSPSGLSAGSSTAQRAFGPLVIWSIYTEHGLAVLFIIASTLPRHYSHWPLDAHWPHIDHNAKHVRQPLQSDRSDVHGSSVFIMHLAFCCFHSRSLTSTRATYSRLLFMGRVAGGSTQITYVITTIKCCFRRHAVNCAGP